VLFATAVTAVTALLFGLLPAWQNSQVTPAATLRDESGSIAGGRSHLRLRKMFVGVQVALSAVLLVGAGLFARSLVNLGQVDLGLDPANVVTFVARPVALVENARKPQVYRTLIDGLEKVPGIVAVGASRNPLLAGSRSDGVFTIAGDVQRAEQPFSFFNGVTPGYFEALGIPVKAGQALTWNDWGTGRRIALVNDALTKAYFDGAAPLTRRIGEGTRSETNVEIVGVVGDARYHDLRGSIPTQTFLNLDAYLNGISRVNVYARVARDPRGMMPRLRAEVARIDPNMVVSGMRTIDDQIGFQMSNERMLSGLSAGFAALATLLAFLGVHGVLAFQVARRRREMGVRLALGAGRGVIVRLVANEMLGVIAGGLAVGLVSGFLSGRIVQSQLFGLDARDPLVFGLTAGALLSAAAVATLIPALRASRIDPVRALRHD
jgi:predicted permease